MNIAIIDCDDERRSLVKARIAAQAPAASVTAASTHGPLPGLPLLVLWHVGDRQQERDEYRVGEQIRAALLGPATYVAGFTGGAIGRDYVDDMPPEGDRFVINDGASAAEIPERFGEAIDKLVRRWAASGEFHSGELAQAWVGMDPVLEAKLDVLTSLLMAKPTLAESSLRLLSGRQVVGSEECARLVGQGSASPEEITRVRDLLFQKGS